MFPRWLYTLVLTLAVGSSKSDAAVEVLRIQVMNPSYRYTFEKGHDFISIDSHLLKRHIYLDSCNSRFFHGIVRNFQKLKNLSPELESPNPPTKNNLKGFIWYRLNSKSFVTEENSIFGAYLKRIPIAFAEAQFLENRRCKR